MVGPRSEDRRNEVPRDAFETISAFANTAGGHLVFGVQQQRDQFEIVGVLALDKVQNDLLSALRSREKISYQMVTTDDVTETETGKLLVFYVPEAPRQHKPVYLDGEFDEVISGAEQAIQRCNEDDIRRFLRAAGGPSYESEVSTSILEPASMRRRWDDTGSASGSASQPRLQRI